MTMIPNQHISSISHHENGSITVVFAHAPARVYHNRVQIQALMDQFCQQHNSEHRHREMAETAFNNCY